jgi:addiction module HigA family antidote
MPRHSSLPPTHPGEVLREDVLPALNISVKATAEKLGVSRQALHALLKYKHPARLSPDMAARLGKLCGNGPDLWLRLQADYDAWHAVREIDISCVPTLAAVE